MKFHGYLLYFLWQWLRISVIPVIKIMVQSITLLLNLLSHILAALKLNFKRHKSESLFILLHRARPLMCVLCKSISMNRRQKKRKGAKGKKKEQSEWWNRPQKEKEISQKSCAVDEEQVWRISAPCPLEPLTDNN